MVRVAHLDASHRSGLTVAIVGAECSGKTTLATQLAQRFDAPCVTEYARGYLERARTDGRVGYDADDVLAIARGQQDAEAAAADGADLVVADTDLVVVKVWWEVRFGGTNAWIDGALRDALSSPRRRRYLLTRPDMPWVPDPLRENPLDRAALHERYRALLNALGVDYVEISGSPEQRLDRAAVAVLRWMNSPSR